MLFTAGTHCAVQKKVITFLEHDGSNRGCGRTVLSLDMRQTLDQSPRGESAMYDDDGQRRGLPLSRAEAVNKLGATPGGGGGTASVCCCAPRVPLCKLRNAKCLLHSSLFHLVCR